VIVWAIPHTLAIGFFYDYYIVGPSAIIRRGGYDCRGFVVAGFIAVFVAAVIAIGIVVANASRSPMAASEKDG